MLFALVILGIYMGWVEAVYGKRPKPVERDAPPIPEFYLRPELIPIKEPGKAAPVVQEAERIVSRQEGTPLTIENIQDALRRLRQ